MTVSALEAEIMRLAEAVAGIKQDASAGKTGTPVHGEVLQKPAAVPQALWPDVGNNEYTWTNTDQRNFALMNATVAYSNIVGIGEGGRRRREEFKKKKFFSPRFFYPSVVASGSTSLRNLFCAKGPPHNVKQ